MKNFTLVLLLFLCIQSYAQDYTGTWKGESVEEINGRKTVTKITLMLVVGEVQKDTGNIYYGYSSSYAADKPSVVNNAVVWAFTSPVSKNFNIYGWTNMGAQANYFEKHSYHLQDKVSMNGEGNSIKAGFDQNMGSYVIHNKLSLSKQDAAVPDSIQDKIMVRTKNVLLIRGFSYKSTGTPTAENMMQTAGNGNITVQVENSSNLSRNVSVQVWNATNTNPASVLFVVEGTTASPTGVAEATLTIAPRTSVPVSIAAFPAVLPPDSVGFLVKLIDKENNKTTAGTYYIKSPGKLTRPVDKENNKTIASPGVANQSKTSSSAIILPDTKTMRYKASGRFFGITPGSIASGRKQLDSLEATDPRARLWKALLIKDGMWNIPASNLYLLQYGKSISENLQEAVMKHDLEAAFLLLKYFDCLKGGLTVTESRSLILAKSLLANNPYSPDMFLRAKGYYEFPASVVKGYTDPNKFYDEAAVNYAGKKALEQLTAADKAGSSKARLYLADMYASGITIPADMAKARSLYNSLLDKKDPEALLLQARMLLLETKPQTQKAIELAETAAQSGNQEAAFFLTQLYPTMPEVNGSYERAVNYLLTIAENGYKPALITLSQFSRKDQRYNVGKDKLYWVRKAALAGHASSVYFMEDYYRLESQTESNRLLAAYWKKESLDYPYNPPDPAKMKKQVRPQNHEDELFGIIKAFAGISLAGNEVTGTKEEWQTDIYGNRQSVKVEERRGFFNALRDKMLDDWLAAVNRLKEAERYEKTVAKTPYPNSMVNVDRGDREDRYFAALNCRLKTSVAVKQGQFIYVEAGSGFNDALDLIRPEGSTTNADRRIVPGINTGAVMISQDGGDWISIGAGGGYMVTADGNLSIAVNEKNCGANNQWYYPVTVYVMKP